MESASAKKESTSFFCETASARKARECKRYEGASRRDPIRCGRSVWLFNRDRQSLSWRLPEEARRSSQIMEETMVWDGP